VLLLSIGYLLMFGVLIIKIVQSISQRKQ
jgi:hypothetical protein